jgi:hypothetical protein
VVSVLYFTIYIFDYFYFHFTTFLKKTYVREFVTGGREVRRRRAKLGIQQSSFIQKTTGNQNNKQMGTKPVAHQRKRAHALTIKYSAQRHGGNRGLNTQHVMMELRPAVWEDKRKQRENEKWIDDG